MKNAFRMENQLKFKSTVIQLSIEREKRSLHFKNTRERVYQFSFPFLRGS